MSVKPKWVAKILNGEKTIEIRKRFPKDFRGWVYIYCTKEQGLGQDIITAKWLTIKERTNWSGKVVGRFWCDKVEDITCVSNGVGTCAYLFTNTYNDIRKASCLNTQDLINYLGAKPNGQIVGKAIPISQLEIFDEPKELSEFRYYKKFSEIDYMLPIPRKETCERLVPLTKAPQSRQYIEVKE